MIIHMSYFQRVPAHVHCLAKILNGMLERLSYLYSVIWNTIYKAQKPTVSIKKGVDSKLKAYFYNHIHMKLSMHFLSFYDQKQPMCYYEEKLFNIILWDVFHSCHIVIDKLVFIKWHFIFPWKFYPYLNIKFYRRKYTMK